MSAINCVNPSERFEGAVYCSLCQTLMHPGNAAPHALRHDTEEALRAAEKLVLDEMAKLRPEDVDHLMCDDFYAPAFMDDVGKAEIARRAAQKAYDEARQ